MVQTLGNTAWGLAIVAALLPAGLAAQDGTLPSSKETGAPIASSSNDASAAGAMTAPTLAAVIEQLSVENRKKFADLLTTDWKKRPEWADMLIVLLKGDSPGPGSGWFKPSDKKYGWKWISGLFDADSDGEIAPDELQVKLPECDQLFARLDRDNDGRLRPDDFEYFSGQPASPPSMMSQYLATLLDTDSNGRITSEELAALLERADADKSGFITSEDLYRQLTRMFADREKFGNDMPRPERMLPMFFKGEFGVLESGPELGETAPDFTLPTHDGSGSVTLSQSRGKPVILIFGSFT